MNCQICSEVFNSADTDSITVRKKTVTVCPKCKKKYDKKSQKERDELIYIEQWGDSDGLEIMVDTREQKPWKFPQCHTIYKAPLVTGDYALKNWEDLVAIDRKELSDIVGCMTKTNRSRFIRELKRMSRYQYSAIIIEANLDKIAKGDYRSRISPESVIGSLISWSIKYGVHVYFASNRTQGAKLCVKIMSLFAKNYIEKHQKITEIVPYFKKAKIDKLTDFKCKCEE